MINSLHKNYNFDLIFFLLFVAAYRGFEEVVSTLLQKNADPNAKSKRSSTPLQLACTYTGCSGSNWHKVNTFYGSLKGFLGYSMVLKMF